MFYLLIPIAVLFLLWLFWRKQGGFGVVGSTPVLDRFSRDLTSLAKEEKIDPVVGREIEIQRLIRILSRRTKNNAVLLGDPGVGKTAIAEGLALTIVKSEVPEVLKQKRVLALELGGLVAGTKYRGEFEKRMQAIADEIRRANRTIILFIDEVQNILETGGAEGGMGAAEILKPLLARGDLQVIGATTIEEYNSKFVLDESLERRFQPIMVSEPSPEVTIEILRGLREKYEDFHQVKITDEAIKAAVNLSDKYLTGRYFPDKAIDVMDEAASKVRLSKSLAADEKPKPAVTAKDVEEVLLQWSKDATSLKRIGEMKG